mgnify:CR=1 FL=1
MTTSPTPLTDAYKVISSEIEDCEQEIMLAEEGMKEAREMLYSFPHDSELKDNLSFYKEEHQYQSKRYEELISKKEKLEVV